jgi:hypothetical protein
MLLSISSEEIITKYKLRTLAGDGWVNIEIRKGMYGLKQTGLLATQLLKNACRLLVNIQIAIQLDFGCKKQGQYLSPSSWMILQ